MVTCLKKSVVLGLGQIAAAKSITDLYQATNIKSPVIPGRSEELKQAHYAIRTQL